MRKKYILSKFQRIASLGIYKYGVIIDNEIIKVYNINLLPIKINIRDIKAIFYGISTSTNTSVYILEMEYGKQLCIPVSFFEGKVYQELIKDLISINNKIELENRVQEFITRDIRPRRKLRFDFSYHKGEFLKRDFQLSQENPSLNTAIGLGIAFGCIIIVCLFWFGGYSLLENIFGTPVASYRVISLVISSFAFCVTFINLFIALISMYLGHRITIISSLICLITMVISLL